MPDFSADLNALVTAGRAWDTASSRMGQAATKADALANSNKEVVWGIFQEAWNAQVKAAQYVSSRSTEAQTETGLIADSLQQVAKVLQEQDQNFANVLIGMDEDI